MQRDTNSASMRDFWDEKAREAQLRMAKLMGSPP